MAILLNGDELKAWHEVGYATVCLHFGGDSEAIEFLEGEARGAAIALGCEVMPGEERHVACDGFAAEYNVLRSGYVVDIDMSDPDAVAR